MSSKGSVALIPERRFPGFTGPWAYEPLSRVLREHKIKNAAGRDVFSVSMESGIVNQIEHLGRSFAAADTSHYNVGHRFDVVYTKSPLKAFPFGIVKQSKFAGDVALSPLYGVFTPKNPHVGLLVEAYFESPERAQAFLSPLCQKGAKNTLQISNATFLSGRMALPKEEGEQKKIADCLQSVDALIAAQGRKIETLRVHKRGLMQRLFPQDGEAQPRLRFPEFQNAGNWQEKSFAAVVDLVSGLHLSPDEYSNNGEVPYFSGPSDFTNELSNAKKWTALAASASKSGDTLITVKGSGVGEAWFSNLPAVALGRQLMAVRPKEDQIGHFVFQFLLTKKRLFEVLGSGNLIPGISRRDILDLKAFFPKRSEQQRIADCLTSLDDLITLEARKLKTLKSHKKGLVQQLFPPVGEPDA